MNGPKIIQQPENKNSRRRNDNKLYRQRQKEKAYKLSVALVQSGAGSTTWSDWSGQTKQNIEGRLSGKEKWNELPLHSEGRIRV